MDAKVFEKYLEERYESQTTWYRRRARQNQRSYYVLKVYAVCAAAAIPVVSALEIPLEIIGALGASIAALEGLAAVFKFHENYLNYRTTAETLKKEFQFFNTRTGEYRSASEPEVLFVERVEAVISRENALWLETGRDRQQTGAAAPP